MARATTRARVHDAILSLARDNRLGAVTMEGIAERAGMSKQTLYRTWPSTGAIVFDALLARSVDDDGRVILPDTGDLTADLIALITGAVSEMTDPVHDQLLRNVTADIQTDETLAAEFRELLLRPQLDAVADRLRRGGVDDPDGVAELLLGPVLHRWLLRTGPFSAGWAHAHAGRVMRCVDTRKQ